jgi:hypothetical protein
MIMLGGISSKNTFDLQYVGRINLEICWLVMFGFVKNCYIWNAYALCMLSCMAKFLEILVFWVDGNMS